MNAENAQSSPARALLRHTVATLAYRAEKVLREPPPGFAEFRVSPTSRSPLEILLHLGDLIEWAERQTRGEARWRPGPDLPWDAAHERFFADLAALDLAIVEVPEGSYSAETIFQGPIADALTHVGQLALLRGAAGTPLRPESYARAEIQIGRTGNDQAPPRAEFDGDASAKRST